MALIDMRDIEKDYSLGRTTIRALRNVSLSVEAGEFTAIVGPSGCGKTTMLNLLGCIDRPTSGSISFDGVPTTGLGDDAEADLRLAKIGFIFQSFNLVPVLTIAENIEVPLMLAGRPKRERRVRVEELMELVGLASYARHKPDELSGGQRQRVAIARALANEPRLVIADEPTANLDGATGESVLEAMKELNEKNGITFLFSTHDPRVMRYARRIVRLRDGEIEGEEAS
ncbi:MAG: lipoprotein-releasing system ATP-binding protein LolD [Spirochaetae bacterium HGW-Spirochaetae-7]|nr:MAG: lipoprotein-releasing system ATP-binding protein LolD [Spirochaetae bacterium HGW-Spirochaetae-7]